MKEELIKLWKRYNKRGLGVIYFNELAIHFGFSKEEIREVKDKIGFEDN